MADKDYLYGRILKGFVVGLLIDEGGHGKVYRGEQPILGRPAVIKVLHPRLRVRDVLRQRFLREAQLASKLDHPYAAHIYGFGVEPDGLLWIAMELVDGITLKQWLRERGPMPIDQAAPFFDAVTEVVQNAHDHGIVHRDLKPSNVMVIERGGRWYPKLLDFGIAMLLDGEKLPESTQDTIKEMRALSAEKPPEEVLQQFRGDGPSTATASAPTSNEGRLTPDDAIIGTPEYMAPEQWSHEFTVGTAADLYALAVVAFEAVTGRRPFEGMSSEDRAEMHSTGKVPSFSSSFPPALDQMFQRAFAKRPEDRFASALELGAALRAASGPGASPADLPRIDAGVRDAWLAGAPQPLAELVAALDSARNAHQAHLAIQELARNLVRYLLVVVLATRAQTREGQDDPVLLDLVRALDSRELSLEERIQLLRLLVRPLTNRRSAHPIPELVDLVTPGPDDADGLDPILALHATVDHAGAEDVVRSRLGQLMPELTQLLRQLTFVLDYVLVVPRDHVAEPWIGLRRARRTPATVIDGELIESHPMLLDRNARVCVDLWPLVQAVPPTEEAEPELFVFDGHGHHDVLLIAAPSGLKYHDAVARGWLATHVVAEVEAQARMRDQIRVAAQQWQNRARPNALLWRGEVLADLERWMRQMTGAAPLSDHEAAFVVASRRAGRRARWIRRLLVAVAVVSVLGIFEYRFTMKERVAELKERMAELKQRTAEQIAQQAEVEQGRQALLLGNLDEAQQHLAEAYRRGDHSPGTAFMLARALQPRLAERARFTAVAGRMWSAAFSPDGRQIVTTDDASARVWDARTHQLMFTLPHGDTVYDARYTTDGTRLVTASGDGAVRIWDPLTGVLVHTLKHQQADGKPPRYFVATLSPDNRLVAAIDTTGTVAHVWNTVSGTPLAELRNDASGFPSIAFSADAHWLATSGGNDARVFDTRTWVRVLTLAGPRIGALSFDPTSSRLVTGSAGGDVAIWEIPSGARAQHLREVGEAVYSVAFSPDGQFVATAGGDGSAQIWDVRSGALRNQINADRTKILSIEFDPTSKLVLAAGDGGAVVVAETLGMPVATFDVPRGVIRTAHFDPTSRYIVGASWDGTVRVWDATSPYRAWSSPPIADDCGLVASLEPDRRFLAIRCRDLATRVWDTARDQLLAELPSVTPVAGDFTSAFPAVDASGDRAAIARGNTVEIYELPGGRLLRTIRHDAPVNAVAFGPVGHDLISGATDGSLLVTRDNRASIALPASSGGVDAAAILPDGRVVAADAHGRLRFYDPDRNTLLADLEMPTRVQILRLSPDGIRLITIPSYTGNVVSPLLWDLAHYRLTARLEGHTGRVFSARFTASGVVTVGGDGAARLWERDTGRLLQTYHSTSRFLADAVIDSDQTMIIASGSDGLLWFWDLPSGRPLWKLQAHRSHVISIHVEGDSFVTRGFAGEISRWVLPSPEREGSSR